MIGCRYGHSCRHSAAQSSALSIPSFVRYRGESFQIRATHFGGPSAVLMARVFHAAHLRRIAIRITAGGRAAAVGGAVVGQKQYPRVVRLSESASNRFVEKFLGVQERDDDRDLWVGVHDSELSKRSGSPES